MRAKKNRVLTLKKYSKRLLLEKKNITVLFFLGGGSTWQGSWCYFSQRYPGKEAYFSYFIKERLSREIEPFLRKKDVLLLHNEHFLATVYCTVIPW
jgi:hypothetical protein